MIRLSLPLWPQPPRWPWVEFWGCVVACGLAACVVVVVLGMWVVEKVGAL